MGRGPADGLCLRVRSFGGKLVSILPLPSWQAANLIMLGTFSLELLFKCPLPVARSVLLETRSRQALRNKHRPVLVLVVRAVLM